MKIAAALLLAFGVPAAAQAPERYTPVEVWRNAEDARFKESWFGEHLASMQAPFLVPGTALKGYRERFRLLILPSFGPPVLISIDERRSGKSTVRVIQTNGRGGYGPGKIVRDDLRVLSGEQFARIAAARRIARFDDRTPDGRTSDFRPDTPPGPADSGIHCMDGTQLVFERRTSAGYRIVSRHECRLDRDLRALADEMIALSGTSVQLIDLNNRRTRR